MATTLIRIIQGQDPSKRWVNGAAGGFRDFDNNCSYRFCEADDDVNAYLLTIQEQRNLPILVTGFIGYLIKHWGKDIQVIVEDYYTDRQNKYVNAHKNDTDSDTRDLKSEFLSEHLQTEEPYFMQSAAVYEYLTDYEANLIKEYVARYKRYVGGKLPVVTREELPKELQTDNAKAKQIKIDKLEKEGALIFRALIAQGFLDTETPCNNFLYRFGLIDKPDTEDRLRWIKTNSTTQGRTPNKRSLLEFLVLLGVDENTVKNKPLINSIFEIPRGNKFSSNNYTDITDINGNLIHFESEYHDELIKITGNRKRK
jgi:hypothetical protein